MSRRSNTGGNCGVTGSLHAVQGKNLIVGNRRQWIGSNCAGGQIEDIYLPESVLVFTGITGSQSQAQAVAHVPLALSKHGPDITVLGIQAPGAGAGQVGHQCQGRIESRQSAKG